MCKSPTLGLVCNRSHEPALCAHIAFCRGDCTRTNPEPSSYSQRHIFRFAVSLAWSPHAHFGNQAPLTGPPWMVHEGRVWVGGSNRLNLCTARTLRGGMGVGMRPWCWFVCLWQRLSAGGVRTEIFSPGKVSWVGAGWGRTPPWKSQSSNCLRHTRMCKPLLRSEAERFANQTATERRASVHNI